ncbi:MAG: hypothetical protein KKA60_14230 [Proteobacteria bacterium]|nr:hypothetical protein [Pseudomonadota bacterium]
MDFSAPVYQGYTLGQALGLAGIVAGLFIVFLVLKKLFSGKRESIHTQAVRCSCGWQGRISSLAGKCPKCNLPLGDRKAR